MADVAVAALARLATLANGAQRRGERVRAAEHAPRDPCRLLERRHGLAEIVERGAGVLVAERLRVSQSSS